MIIHIEDGAIEYFNIVVKKDQLEINIAALLQQEILPKYIEVGRRKIFYQGFGPILKRAFKKSDFFINFEEKDKVIQRVVF